MPQSTDFWNWFIKNEELLFAVTTGHEPIVGALAVEMAKVDSNLTFEFGPVHEGMRDFVISADGIKASFPAVERLYADAPATDRWTWVKFRPRREAMDLEIGDLRVQAETVQALLLKDPDPTMLGVAVVIPGCAVSNHDVCRMAAYLLLDQALGEFDVEMRVGRIETLGRLPAANALSHSLDDLPKAFDAALQRKLGKK